MDSLYHSVYKQTDFTGSIVFSLQTHGLVVNNRFNFPPLFRTLNTRGYNFFTGSVNKEQFVSITGASIGLAKRLRVPDDYFTLSQSLSYQYYNLQNYFTGLFTFGQGKSNNVSYTVALSRNNTFTNPIFPLGGSEFVLSARFQFPYSLWNGADYGSLGELPEFQDSNGDPDQSKIDQEKYKWLEFYKIKFKGSWYTRLFDKLVLRTHAEFGFLGAYNNDRGVIPFDRFFLGGDGMSQYARWKRNDFYERLSKSIIIKSKWINNL